MNHNFKPLSLFCSTSLLLLSASAQATSMITSYSDFNALGLAQTVTDAAGRITKMQYDNNGLLLQSTQCGSVCGSENDVVTEYGYHNGQLKIALTAYNWVLTCNYGVCALLQNLAIALKEHHSYAVTLDIFNVQFADLFPNSTMEMSKHSSC